jgi:hypothetical protein
MSDIQPTESIDTDLLWHLTGARAGPTLLVLGDVQSLAPVVARLQMLPSLVYLRGAIKVGGEMARVDADEVLALPDGEPESLYWAILTRLSNLGMISGRGIPQERFAA